MSARRLVSLRRPVPPARRGDYDAAWLRLRDEATARGAHAWRFRAAEVEDLFLEFLEFAAEADPRAAPGVAEALRALDAGFGPAATEEWLELKDAG